MDWNLSDLIFLRQQRNFRESEYYILVYDACMSMNNCVAVRFACSTTVAVSPGKDNSKQEIVLQVRGNSTY